VTRRSRVLRRRSSAPLWRGPSGELSSGRGSLPLRYRLSSLQFLLLYRMKIRIAVHSQTKACIAALSLSCRFAFPPCTISWTLCRCWYVSCARFLSFSKYPIFPFVSLIVPLPCRCALSPVLLLRDLRFDPSWYSSCTRVLGTRTSSHIGSLVLWVHRWFPFYPDDTMLRFLKKRIKHKKSPEPPQPGIPAKITGIPPGFRADLDIAPEGE
jgi:hypothetical protein